MSQPESGLDCLACAKFVGWHLFDVKKSTASGQRGSTRTQGYWVTVQDSEFRVQDAGFKVQGPGSRVQGPGFRVQGSGLRV